MRKAVIIIASLLAFAVSVCSLILQYKTYKNSGNVLTAYAAGSKAAEYSDVLSDLKQDESFNESDYPAKENDYNLRLVQIAESTDGELLIYVYQPCHKAEDVVVYALSINISTAINDSLKYKNYKLEYINGSDTLFKYKVLDFELKEDALRYYDISNIFRTFIPGVDRTPGFGNTITEKACGVGQLWTAVTVDGKVSYNYVITETIEVTDKFVGFVRYPDGYKFYGAGACDSHFVAFDTDKRIDKLYEADVYYTKQSCREEWRQFGGDRITFGDKTDEYAELKYTQKEEYHGSGLFAGTYKWDRIESIEQFISEVDFSQKVYTGALINVKVASKITSEGRAALENKKWVLRFTETAYSERNSVDYDSGQITSITEDTTLVGDVTILRLKFETDGVVYNLGIVDNKQSGSRKPINKVETSIEKGVVITTFEKIFNWLKRNWKTLLIVIASVVLFTFLVGVVVRVVHWVKDK